MSQMLEVIKGVPIPPVNRKGARRKYPIETMEIDDAFFEPGDRATRSVVAYVSRIASETGRKFTARRCWMKRDAAGKWQLSEAGQDGAEEGTGVWRIE